MAGKTQEGKKITFKGKTIKPDDTTTIVKGKIISYIADSIPGKNSLKIAQDADLFICDATYKSDLQEKADKHMHMTAKQAAAIANKSNVKKLIVTHMSARYKDFGEVENDAKESFDNIKCAYDFMKVKL